VRDRRQRPHALNYVEHPELNQTAKRRSFILTRAAGWPRIRSPEVPLMPEAKFGGSQTTKWVLALLLIVFAVFLYFRR